MASIAFAVTEACDAVDSLFKALPKPIRKAVERDAKARSKQRFGERYYDPKFSLPRGATCADKAKSLYDNWREIDLDDAIKNLLKNMIEDMLVGAKSKAIDDFRKGIGAPATKVLDETLEPYIPDVKGNNPTQAAAKALDKLLERGWDRLVPNNSDHTAGDLQDALVKRLSLQ